ncbi:MAG: hypothetical protein ACK5T0_00460 [Vampirovibrionales bacterium]
MNNPTSFSPFNFTPFRYGQPQTQAPYQYIQPSPTSLPSANVMNPWMLMFASLGINTSNATPATPATTPLNNTSALPIFSGASILTPSTTAVTTPATTPLNNTSALPIFGGGSITTPSTPAVTTPATTTNTTNLSTLPIWDGSGLSTPTSTTSPFLTASMNDIFKTITSGGVTVAAGQNSSYWGDPHVADADRANQEVKNTINFNVYGAGTFNLLKDKNIALSAEHKKYDAWKIEVTNQVNLALGDSNLVYNAYGEPTLNGVKLEKDKLMTLSDGSKVTWNGSNKLNVTNANYGEYNLDINLRTSGQKNADGTNIKYFDTYVNSTDKGVFSDGILPTGILGEGFDMDNAVRTKLNFGLENYKV